MLQWFLRFPEFAEFNESSAPFRENSIGPIASTPWKIIGTLSNTLNVIKMYIVVGRRCVSRNISLPTASEGWGKVMFSVCSHLRGVPRPGRARGGGILHPGLDRRVFSHQIWWEEGFPYLGGGTPPRLADGVLDTPQSVCLFRSHRRTFLLEIWMVPWKCVIFHHSDERYENIQLQAFIKWNT